MKFEDKNIENVSDLLKNLKLDCSEVLGPFWFRGHSDSSWKLIPSINRSSDLSEIDLLKKFRQNSTLIVERKERSQVEWLFLMRHYGVPTRLLDWTESALIALYFAVEKKDELDQKDGVFWILIPSELNKLANISPQSPFELPSFEYEPQLLQSYTPEIFNAENISNMLPVAFVAPRSNPRMQAQLSVFTINHRNKTPLEDLGDGSHIWRYIIPKEKKEEIRKELKMLGITKFQIYPELQSIGEELSNVNN